MLSTMILGVAFCVSLAVNFLHWRARSDSRFLYPAVFGWPGHLFRAWLLVLPLAGLLALCALISMQVFLQLNVGMCVASQIYSVVRRQRASMGHVPPTS